ncbi:unnamed protein product [Adineta steineri]|uniref:Uncharacterized protein n=1 Tax=Adineta steineri TaxID=433720 RepID=A0A814X5M5_9BILA|nr:unnamed protein product [Adineta steineri]CAF1206904.1 unnamed protein product [Adineta steineri]CAF1484329.1 unnamed protein product [Adineta steineri]
MNTFIGVIVVVLIQQHIQLTHGISCASDPCRLLGTAYGPYTGHCCYDVPGSTDSVCVCPNNVAPVLNGPCLTGTAVVSPTTCNRACVNGGVCNIVSNQQVCWCTLGYSGSFCEIQGIATRCATGLCQSGTCVEQSVGTSLFAYCHCNPGWSGPTCSLNYFTCTTAGVFPDTAYCATGRYFYCAAAGGAPVSAMCPDGQKFDRLTNVCSTTATC